MNATHSNAARNPKHANAAWARWFDALACAEAKLLNAATDAATPITQAERAEIRAMRDRLQAVRRAHDRDALEAMAADDTHPRQAWAKQALA